MRTKGGMRALATGVATGVAGVVLALSGGCTVYEAYVVKETRSQPARPVEVAREGGISDFDKVLVAGADVATAIIAPLAVVAKAAVVSIVDVEVNRSKETRVVKSARWFTTDESAFPAAAVGDGELFGQAAIGEAKGGAAGEAAR